MPSRSKTFAIVLLVGLSTLAFALPARAAEMANSEFVIIQEGDVVHDDLYAGAIKVVVEGRVEGDLIAFAAEEVIIDGTVTGSVSAVAPRVTVNGEVEGSLRAVANTLTINGSVGRDVVGPVFRASVGEAGEVANDLLLWAWNVETLGTIGADLLGTMRRLDLAGHVRGDVDVTVNTLTVVDDLVVDGDLGYRSNRSATGLEMASVGGTVVHKTPLPPNLRVRALTLLGRFMVILFLTVAALTTAYGWPQRTTRAVEEVGRKPIRRWLRGAVVVFSPLIAVALTAVFVALAPPAASFPLLVVLVPAILALVGLVAALGLVAGAPVVGWLGGVLFKRLDLYGSIVAGSALVGIVWYVPWVGLLVPLIVLPLGLGAWMATFAQSSEESSFSSEAASAPR